MTRKEIIDFFKSEGKNRFDKPILVVENQIINEYSSNITPVYQLSQSAYKMEHKNVALMVPMPQQKYIR